MIKKNIRQWMLWIASVIIISCSIFSLLVFTDYILARYILPQATENINKKAIEIEKKRFIQEDEPQRRKALLEGFLPLFYPATVEQYDVFLKLAKKTSAIPLAPQPHTNVYFCNEGYGLIKYRTDRFGFRNLDKVWDELNLDLVVIGDSFVHGACVPSEQTISGLLLRKYKALNLGTMSNQPIHYAAIAKVFLPKLDTKNVVMVFYSNDNDNWSHENNLLYRNYFKNDVSYFSMLDPEKLQISNNLEQFYSQVNQLLALHLKEELQPARFLERGNVFLRISKYFSLSNIRGLIYSIIKSNSDIEIDLGFSSKLAIQTLADLCELPLCQPIILYIPNSDFWRPDPYSEEYSRALSRASKKNELIFIDASNALKKLGLEAYAVQGPHLSPKGYKIISNLINRNLN